MNGRVVTFYSYKGGVGRTFLLANCAALLAEWGYRVLCVDFDLEAPGLHQYLRTWLPPSDQPGLVDLLLQVQAGEQPDWASAERKIAFDTVTGRPFRGQLHLLPAGRPGETETDYRTRQTCLSWDRLYSDDARVGPRLDEARSSWTERYDLILVDSRTGFTDAQGITTALLPDIITFLFTANVQSLEGVAEVMRLARRQRQALPFDRRPQRFLPVTARWDGADFPGESQAWRHRIHQALHSLVDDWRDPATPSDKLLARLRLDYRARWSFGEWLAVREEPWADPTTTAGQVALISALLAGDLCDAADVVARPAELVARAARGPASHGQADLCVDLGAEPERMDRLAHALQDRGLPLVSAPLVEGRPSAGRLVTVADAGLARSPARQQVVLAYLAEPACRVVFLAPSEGAVSPLLALWEQAAATGADIDAATVGLTALDVPPAPVQTPLARYRAWLRRRHADLVPFFQEQGRPGLLETVYVELGLELDLPDKARQAEADPRSLGGHTLEDLLEAPDAPRAWLIVGEPGAGKTTLVRHLAWTTGAPDVSAIVALLPLARLSAGELPDDPLAWAAADAAREDPDQDAESLAQALKGQARDGQLWLVLDGWDEVAPDRLEAVRDWLRTLPRRLPRARLVATTRPVALEGGGLGRTWRQARVRPLDDDGQRSLLTRLLGAEAGQSVWRVLERRPALRGLTRNPLMLTLAAMVGREADARDAALPARRTRLFQQAIDLLLRRGYCPEPRGVRDRTLARQVLQQLSHDLQEGGGETWERKALVRATWALLDADSTLQQRVLATWSSVDGLLDDLGANSGVLGPHDGPGLPWRYLHRSLREHLAAEWLQAQPAQVRDAFVARWREEVDADQQERREAARKGRPQTQAPSRDPSRWGEVYALFCGLTDDPLTKLEPLRAHGDLARRALLSVDGIEPLPAARFLVSVEGWQPDELARLVDGWGLEPDQIADQLLELVDPQASSRLLGLVWAMVTELRGVPPERVAFFQQAGRPVERVPTIDLVPIPAGTFWMGSLEGVGESVERPRHRVTLTQPYRLGRSAVTIDQFRHFEPGRGRKGDHRPVGNVDWWEATAFCAWVGGRLPTEAEWEHACRAGTDTTWSFGDDPVELPAHGWFDENSGSKAHPVGQKAPNPWGLCDMHGNVWEWCADDRRAYQDRTETDPRQPPVSGPAGSTTSFDVYRHQPRHSVHSLTLPCMSDRPQALLRPGWPTASRVFFMAAWAARSFLSSPNHHRVSVPARQATSHSASVGKRPPTHAANRRASNQETRTTECFCGLPSTLAGSKGAYCPLVTGVRPRA